MAYRTDNFYSSMADKVAEVIRIGDGKVLNATAINTATSDRFFQLFDRTTTPQVNDKPIFSIPVYRDNGYSEIDERVIGLNGITFDRGICWAMSTSAGNYQPAAITDAVVTIVWM